MDELPRTRKRRIELGVIPISFDPPTRGYVDRSIGFSYRNMEKEIEAVGGIYDRDMDLFNKTSNLVFNGGDCDIVVNNDPRYPGKVRMLGDYDIGSLNDAWSIKIGDAQIEALKEKWRETTISSSPGAFMVGGNDMTWRPSWINFFNQDTNGLININNNNNEQVSIVTKRNRKDKNSERISWPRKESKVASGKRYFGNVTRSGRSELSIRESIQGDTVSFELYTGSESKCGVFREGIRRA